MLSTCQSSIKLEYNMEEYYKALTDILDWENPKGDRCPFDLSKPLPLKGRPGHLTIAIDYFFNNDLEYLKSGSEERKYTTSITKTKAANQNRRDLPRDILLDRIEILTYYTKGVKVRKGIMQTKTELTLEQTQQGVSDEVLFAGGAVGGAEGSCGGEFGDVGCGGGDTLGSGEIVEL
ncbi:hypothetical protein Tco_1232581, partial [Tanacetum coccineum]